MYVIRTWSPFTLANSESNQSGITYLTKDLKSSYRTQEHQEKTQMCAPLELKYTPEETVIWHFQLYINACRSIGIQKELPEM